MGIRNQANLRILRERITGVPIIVDAGGVGTASDASFATIAKLLSMRLQGMADAVKAQEQDPGERGFEFR